VTELCDTIITPLHGSPLRLPDIHGPDSHHKPGSFGANPGAVL
jgi:hypothetical protein